MSANFSDRIKAARQRLGLSQSQAARKWGFPKQTINAWEKGIRNPVGLYLKKLERVLKRSEN
jgi:DNA-binding transcriptional regulator YiaG